MCVSDAYAQRHTQVLPRTVDLRDAVSCEAFFRHNHQLAPVRDSLWFLKDVKGSTGRHIRYPADEFAHMMRSVSADEENPSPQTKP